tara:strand:+ start:340 stop:1302 length:963 start_codon:yes stop_codon:yes gene_type:complete
MKKSYEQLIDSLKAQGFKFTFAEFDEIGNYLPEDSDWNYKDVTHLNHVHTKVHSVLATALDDMTTCINLQNISLLGVKIPLSMVNYEFDKFNQIYFTSSGPFVIIGNTLSELHGKDQTKVITKFAIGSKGFVSIFHPLIKFVLSKNHKKLMEEDTPMRVRRGLLRKNGHSFYIPKETYPFYFSEEISRSNIFLKKIDNGISISKKDLYKKGEKEESIGEEIGIYSFFTTNKDGQISLWTSTCSHEGAFLSKQCLKKNILKCPWHGRKIQPLLTVNNEKNIKIIPSIDYVVREETDHIKIKFRNEPEYYNKKPYKFLSFEN